MESYPMMWKIGEFCFNANTNVLTLNEKDTVLEPKVADLLRYFCENPQRDISRDELLERVWHGQVVSDSAINRTIVKLRKVLGDNDKIKLFVVTVPKIGYRFAIHATAFNQLETIETVELLQQQSESSLFGRATMIIFALIIVTSGCLYLFAIKEYKVEEQQATISPLLRLSITQSDGAVSNNGRFLAFVAPSQHGVYQLHVKDSITGVTHVVSPGKGDAHSPYWTDQNDGIYYLYYAESGCEIHYVSVEHASFHQPNSIYNCGAADVKNIVYQPQTNELVLVEREKMYSPFQVYGVSIDTKKKRKLQQPIAVGLGNHFIDRDRQSNQLLLLHDPVPNKTKVYTLDMQQDTSIALQTLPYNVNAALWNHQATGIVHPSEHPSYHLIETSLGSGASKVLVTDTRRITEINRMANNKDYLFTSYIYNRDIRINGRVDPLINSSVMDYLPSLSRDGSTLAFVSKRDGYSKVFIMKVGEQLLTSIELPDKGRLFYDLIWSFDDSKLLANTNQGLIIYDLHQQRVEQVLDMPTTVVGAGWYDKDRIHYSIKENEQWQINIIDLAGKVTERIIDSYAFVIADYHQGNTDYVWFDQSLAPWWQEKPLKNDDCGYALMRFRVAYQLSDGVVYCRSREQNQILRIDSQGEVATYQQADKLPYHFSVSNGHWVTWYVSSNVSDLIRTNL